MNVYPVSPGDDIKTAGYSTISHNYQKIILQKLPSVNNVPVFDYMLLGMGADGHIGSLYANRSLTHSLTHSLTYSLTHSLTHSLTRSLTRPGKK